MGWVGVLFLEFSFCIRCTWKKEGARSANYRIICSRLSGLDLAFAQFLATTPWPGGHEALSGGWGTLMVIERPPSAMPWPERNIVVLVWGP